MFVLILTYTQPFAEVEKQLDAHRSFLRECYAKGLLLCSGPQSPRTGGVIISLQAHQSDVQALIAQDPFFIHGLADYKIIEFDPVLYADGFQAFLPHKEQSA